MQAAIQGAKSHFRGHNTQYLAGKTKWEGRRARMKDEVRSRKTRLKGDREVGSFQLSDKTARQEPRPPVCGFFDSRFGPNLQ